MFIGELKISLIGSIQRPNRTRSIPHYTPPRACTITVIHWIHIH